MSTIVLPAEIKKASPNGHAGHGHHELSFVRKYFFSTDHKMIAKQFLFFSMFFLLVGGMLALIVRLQLGWPDHQSGFFQFFAKIYSGIFGKEVFAFNKETGMYGMLDNFYNSAFTMHATFMIFFAVMPFLMGTFANFLIPLEIGAGDMAFPKLNMASFWMAVLAGILMLTAFFVKGGAAAGGWMTLFLIAEVVIHEQLRQLGR